MRHAVHLMFVLAAALPAQTGPWTDGELIVHTTTPSGQRVLLRIAPENGDAEPLASPGYWGGWSGSMVFDPYRHGLLANCSLPPDPTFAYKLWLIRDDGAATAIPGFAPGVTLRALCPVGDGRVYYQRHGVPGTPEIRWFDAANVQHTLLDATGSAPFAAPQLEHLLWHAPTNSLIGCGSAWWSGSVCTPGSGSVVRIPLTVDGSRVAGPMLCGSTGSAQEHFTGFDHLPDGRILLTMGTSYIANDRMRAIDPVTLAVSPWANPQPSDLGGGIWSSRVGAAIGLDDANPVALRTWNQGGSGVGVGITTDLPIFGSGGYSPFNRLAEVNLAGSCSGQATRYGAGLAGNGGLVPSLGVAGCPELQTGFSIVVDNCVGGGFGIFALGVAPAALPLLGGTLLVNPVLATPTFTCGGQPGIPGAGNAGLAVQVVNPALVGATFYAQAGVFDAAAGQGVAFSNGVRIVIG